MRRSKDDPIAREWETRTKNVLKAELKRRGMGYSDLVAALQARGVEETERNLANKISRGSFSAAFLLQCLEAIGVSRIDLSE